MGLGDRHSSNILVDEVTAEVVHIDLGVAFEQVRGATGPSPFQISGVLTRIPGTHNIRSSAAGPRSYPESFSS